MKIKDGYYLLCLVMISFCLPSCRNMGLYGDLSVKVSYPHLENLGKPKLEYCRQTPIKYTLPNKRELPQNLHHHIQLAIHKWELAVGKKLFEETYFDGDLATNTDDGFRNQILEFRFPPTEYLPRTLRNSHVGAMATTMSLSRMNRRTNRLEIRSVLSDIWYNTAYFQWGDASEMVFDPAMNVSDLEVTTLHELGHVLGLSHNQDNYSIMNATTNYHVKRLREGGMVLTSPPPRFFSRKDIQRIHTLCGCMGEACDV
ncbi:MAG: matrixin family metalloprotease, partial [Proteobacteria bacterium]|nr:matrixin family metalloprotease [Pseudomonadota bacterium]